VIHGSTIVVDIGKTNAKVSLWNGRAELMERRVRSNDPQQSPSGYRALDVAGIDAWLIESISAFAGLGPVARIITVGHGAAAVLVRNGRLYLDPMDYEDEVSAAERASYRKLRDPFPATGSPALPEGLNLGIQLYRLEQLTGEFPDDVLILPWPQYWSWRLCGVPASEVSSLGCHTDLWLPKEQTFSELAVKRGWAERMAPLRKAGDVLGPITAELAGITGLNRECQVLCGLHDSNAALLASWGHPEIADSDATVLSTGTWFIAMRSPAAGTGPDMCQLEEQRDCLVNVDVYGRPTPSARFMGGRELELIVGTDSFALTDGISPDDFMQRLPRLIAAHRPPLPSFVTGVGPFPNAKGAWPDRPKDPVDQLVLTQIYLALMAHASLGLIGSRDRLLVEGRFAQLPVFVRALSSLRSGQRVFTSNAEHDVAFGALRLVAPGLSATSELMPVKPLDFDITEYAAHWYEQAQLAQERA
jgi:hypothetical protein